MLVLMCVCLDLLQLWGLDLSDSNQQSDWEAGRCKRELPSNNNEETPELDIQDPYSLPICSITTSQYSTSNIGYYVFEYREEEEDTGRLLYVRIVSKTKEDYYCYM